MQSIVGMVSHILQFVCCIGIGAGGAFSLHDLRAAGPQTKAEPPVKNVFFVVPLFSVMPSKSRLSSGRNQRWQAFVSVSIYFSSPRDILYKINNGRIL